MSEYAHNKAITEFNWTKKIGIYLDDFKQIIKKTL